MTDKVYIEIENPNAPMGWYKYQMDRRRLSTLLEYAARYLDLSDLVNPEMEDTLRSLELRLKVNKPTIVGG